ncbi:oxygen-insensitive NADPH nitroreductase, partial [Leuconostoc citreum]|nr:oxygen-insensitive NADPH nitroreductase [Leuconostoc citreum]MCT3062733.1 oxygen-insensitive NADPH nitroreductase [Leuconostoc citreum]
ELSLIGFSVVDELEALLAA